MTRKLDHTREPDIWPSVRTDAEHLSPRKTTFKHSGAGSSGGAPS